MEILNRSPSSNWLVVTGWGLSIPDLMKWPLNTIKQLGFSQKAKHPYNQIGFFAFVRAFFLIKYENSIFADQVI